MNTEKIEIFDWEFNIDEDGNLQCYDMHQGDVLGFMQVSMEDIKKAAEEHTDYMSFRDWLENNIEYI